MSPGNGAHHEAHPQWHPTLVSQHDHHSHTHCEIRLLSWPLASFSEWQRRPVSECIAPWASSQTSPHTQQSQSCTHLILRLVTGGAPNHLRSHVPNCPSSCVQHGSPHGKGESMTGNQQYLGTLPSVIRDIFAGWMHRWMIPSPFQKLKPLSNLQAFLLQPGFPLIASSQHPLSSTAHPVSQGSNHSITTIQRNSQGFLAPMHPPK